MLGAFDPTFIYANYVEACLWAGIAVVVFIKRKGTASVVLAVALLLFGFSDLVETRTGGWYKPWWLLTWKVACVVTIAASGLFMFWKTRGSSARFSDD